MTKHAGVHEKGTFTLADLMNALRANPDFHKAGAVALFVGVARGETVEKETVEKLELEAYAEKADAVLESICRDLMTKPGIVDVQIHHLVGTFEIGEELVYVAVAGGHRQNVFRVLEEAVERYKHEAPIFKKEHVIDKVGKRKAYWVSEQEHQSTCKEGV